MKLCARCRVKKPLSQFHRQPSGPKGRHSYCKSCANKAQRVSRIKNVTPERKRAYQFMTRYGLTIAQVSALLAAQGGRCAICRRKDVRFCVDHNHKTKKTRGILCHRCNVGLGFMESMGVKKALSYLERTA